MKKIILMVVLCAFMGCNNDDDSVPPICTTALCAIPSIELQFVTTDTGEDVFLNKTYSEEDFSVIDLVNNVSVPFRYVVDLDNDRAMFILEEGQNVSSDRMYSIIIGEQLNLILAYNTIASSENICCPGVSFESINLVGANFENDGNNNSSFVSLIIFV